MTFAAARNRERGESAVKQLEEEGLQSEFLPLDVNSEESIRTAKETVEKKYGRLDVLINNAGVLLRVSGGGIITCINTYAAYLHVRRYSCKYFGYAIHVNYVVVVFQTYCPFQWSSSKACTQCMFLISFKKTANLYNILREDHNVMIQH